MVLVAAETEERDELVGLGALAALEHPSLGQREDRRGQRGPSPRFERDLHGLEHGQVGEQVGRLERPAETEGGPARRRQLRDVVAEDLDRAGGRDEPSDRVHHRRLAGAIGPDEADDLTLAHFEIDVVDGHATTEGHGDARGPQRGNIWRERLEIGLVHDARRDRGPLGLHELLSREPSRHRAEDGVAKVQDDLHEPTWEVEDQDQKPRPAGEEPSRRRVADDRWQADHPERAEQRSGMEESPPITAIATTRNGLLRGERIRAELDLEAGKEPAGEARRVLRRHRTPSASCASARS